jgi:hypothetical protein
MKFTAALIAASLIAAPALAGSTITGEKSVMQDHAHDFDFLIGRWKVHHRRLAKRLTGNHDWVEFEGTSQLWMTMNGHGTVDDNYIGLPSGDYRAMGIRSYDPATQTWAIWWIDARNPHDLEPPVKGNFQNGVGNFEGEDTFAGKRIKVRYIWSRITPTSAHWEQAFSPDDGKTWETNWRMDFTRTE